MSSPAEAGIILGVPGESKSKIATTRRVNFSLMRRKVLINIGNLLVASDSPGHAMRSKPIEVAGAKMHRPGTIVGKVFEPLAAGKREILVLLSIQ